MKIGSQVKCIQYYKASHEPHGIKEGVVYTVLQIGFVAGTLGVAVNSPCPQGESCSCKNISKPFWVAAGWEEIETFTEEDVQKATPMPSVEDVASFFQARTT